jgi:hypothetical protein
MNFLRHLKAAWRYGKQIPFVPESEKEGFWTKENALETERFFNSETGRKLGIRLTNFNAKIAQAAVQNPNGTQWLNGQASGVTVCIAAIEAHYPQRDQEEQEESAIGSGNSIVLWKHLKHLRKS